MLNDEIITTPSFYEEILAESSKLAFNMLSDLKTGSLLRTLSASKPGGNILELGTGTGLSLTWIAEGADDQSTIVTVDNDPGFQSVAKNVFKDHHRIIFHCEDGSEWLKNYKGPKFDLIFADAWPGKFENLQEALHLLNPGGFYLIDDLLPQPNWPEGHQSTVDRLLEVLTSTPDFVYTTLNWSTGLMLFTRST